MEKNTQIALERYASGEQPTFSTFIDEDTITAGYGDLDSTGFWEFPLPKEWIIEKMGTVSWSEWETIRLS